MNTPKTTDPHNHAHRRAKSQVALAERRGRILELRARGHTLAEIGREVGIHESGVSRALHDALNQIDRVEYRELIRQRLERLFAQVEKAVMNGKLDVKAATEARNLCAELSKLCGLYPKEEPPQAQVAIKVIAVDMARFMGQTAPEQPPAQPAPAPGAVESPPVGIGTR